MIWLKSTEHGYVKILKVSVFQPIPSLERQESIIHPSSFYPPFWGNTFEVKPFFQHCQRCVIAAKLDWIVPNSLFDSIDYYSHHFCYLWPNQRPHFKSVWCLLLDHIYWPYSLLVAHLSLQCRTEWDSSEYPYKIPWLRKNVWPCRFVPQWNNHIFHARLSSRLNLVEKRRFVLGSLFTE